MKKIIASAIALALVVSASSASAQSYDIATLLVQIQALQAQIAALTGGSSVAVGTFTKDLAMGARDVEVMNLQKFLNNSATPVATTGVGSKGYETNYFGSKTKAALMAYQAWANLPVTGMVDSWTRAKINGGSVVTNPTTGTTVVTTPGTITTNGVEGTIVVTKNGSPAQSNVYENDSQTSTFGIKVEAKNSDLLVQRVKVQLPSSNSYIKVLSKIYIKSSSGAILASSDLNSSTVVKDGSNYYITISGINYKVAKGTSDYLIVGFDVRSAISGYIGSYTITIPQDGVRATDGAGIDQYGPATQFTHSITANVNLVDSATLRFSTNSGTVRDAEVVAYDGTSHNEKDAVTLLSFDVRAERSDVKLTDVVATIGKSGTGAATASSSVYLYDGSTIVGSASVSGTTATFSNINLWITKDTTKTLTLKVDVKNANGTASVFTASVTGSAQTAENVNGSGITPTGSATSNSITVRNVGPVFTLVSKSIAVDGSNQSGSTVSTSTLRGTFSVSVQAIGGDITFGNQASGTPMFTFSTYKTDGSVLSTTAASTTGFTIPSSGVVPAGSNSFTLQQDNSVTLSDVVYTVKGKDASGAVLATGPYSMAITGITWSNDTGATSVASTFMNGKSEWKTVTQNP